MSFTQNPFGDRGSGGGREPGRRGLPGPGDRFSAPPPPATTTTTTTTTNNNNNTTTSSAAPPLPTTTTTASSAPVSSAALPPLPPSTSLRRSARRNPGNNVQVQQMLAVPPPPPSTTTTTTPTFSALVPRQVHPQDFVRVAPNNMKLKVVLQYGCLLPADVLEYDNGIYRLHLRISRIGHPGHLYFVLLDPETAAPEAFATVRGRSYFENPAEIVAALRARFTIGSNPATHWQALVLFRDGERVGTLNEVRENLRVAGRQAVEEVEDEDEDEVAGAAVPAAAVAGAGAGVPAVAVAAGAGAGAGEGEGEEDRKWDEEEEWQGFSD